MQPRPKPRYQPGDKIGGHYLVAQCIMGGMGEIYLCLDLQNHLPFALKTFQRRVLMDSKLRAAFENEVATWVALEKHPNVVRCFRMDILDNQPFMILEWIANAETKGTDLRSWLLHGPLDLRLALDFTIDICRGLVHAQEKQPGIVHRDLKPDNILVSEGRLAKITDWGLAKIIQESRLEIISAALSKRSERQSLLGQGGIVGTPPYMAPEQWQGEKLDVRTDIYAVGCILYELLTGSRPFQSTALTGLRLQHMGADIPKLTESQPLPDAFDELLARCLSKKREKRIATANDLLQELTIIYQQQFSEPPQAVSVSSEFTAADYINRGLTYRNLKQYDRALRDCRKAIQLAPDVATAYYCRGLTHVDLERYHEALADLTRAIQLDPRHALSYFYRAKTYATLERWDEALVDYDRAIQLDPTEATAYHNVGVILANRYKYREALPYLEKATELGLTQSLEYVESVKRYLGSANDFVKRMPGITDFFEEHFGLEVGTTERSDIIANASGRFGYDTSNPIPVAGPKGQRQYLSDLLCECGESFEFHRVGGFGAGPDGHVVDGYDLVCGKGTHRIRLYMDMWHTGPSSLIPEGLSRKAWPKPQVDLLESAFKAFQEANSNREMQYAVAEFPFMTGTGFIKYVEQDMRHQIPPEHRLAFGRRLAWLRHISEEQAVSARSAQKAFRRAGSPGEMRRAVETYPIMKDTKFIADMEMALAMLPLEEQRALSKRLTWLRQIANEQQ